MLQRKQRIHFVLLSLAMLIALGLSFPISEPFLNKSVQEDFAKNSVRQTLLRQEVSNQLSPTEYPAQYPFSLYDTLIEKPGSIKDSFYTIGENNLNARLRWTQSLNRLEIAFKFNNYQDTYIYVEDHLKRTIGFCALNDCKKPIIISKPIYGYSKIRIEGKNRFAAIDTVTLQFTPKKKSQHNIPHLNLKLSALQKLHLTHLTESAMKSLKNGQGLPAKQIRGELKVNNSSFSPIRIALSGRTPAHLEFLPSMEVEIESGSTIFGSKKFKLYRWETRSHLLDFVASSILEDIGIPVAPQNLIRLSLNDKYVGLYLFEERFSPSFFENIKTNESLVVGFDNTRLMEETQKFPRYLNKLIYKLDHKEPKIDITSPDFIDELDAGVFSKYLAFAALFMATHTLGADDLRFYKNSLNGRFYPLAKDLKLGFSILLNPRVEIGKVGSMHFSHWINQRPVSPEPWYRLIDFEPPNYQGKSHYLKSVLLWDTHPSVIHFMDKVENRLLSENYLQNFIEEGLVNVFKKRVTNLADELRKGPLTNKELSVIKKTLSHFKKDEKQFTTEPWIEKITQSNKPLLIAKGASATLINTLPFSLNLTTSSLGLDMSNCFKGTSGALLSPYWQRFNIHPPKVILKHATPPQSFRPSCTIYSATPLSASQWLSNIQATLISGKSIQLKNASFSQKTPLARKLKTKKKTIALSLWSQTRTNNEYALTYALHTNSAWSKKPRLSKIAIKDLVTGQTNNIGIVQSNPSAHTALPFVSKGLEELSNNPSALYQDPRSLTSKQSILVTLKLPLKINGQYISLDINDLITKLTPSLKRFSFVTLQPAVVFIPPRSDATKIAEPLVGLSQTKWLENKLNGIFESKEHVNISLDSTLHVKQNERLVINKGVNFLLGPNAAFLIEGEIRIKGSKLHPVIFKPTDKNWGGLQISHSPRINSINHAKFYRSRQFKHGSAESFGGISIINSTVEFNHSLIKDFVSKDAFNAFKSKIVMKGSRIEGSIDDGLDSDFSFGRISTSQFLSAGGDNADFNQSHFSILDSQFEYGTDKGISAGEKSILSINGCTLENNKWGIAVKDLAQVSLVNSKFNSQEIAISQLVKKPWYNSSEIFQENNDFRDNEINNKNLGYFRY